jgi:predicted Fe-S protein YdhL (DUF1289 family)
MKISSPCMDICKLNENGVCIGCFRTRDEIAKWSQISDIAKSFINDAADERRRLHLENCMKGLP